MFRLVFHGVILQSDSDAMSENCNSSGCALVVQMKLTVAIQQVHLHVNAWLGIAEKEYSAQVNCLCRIGYLLLSYYDLFTLTGIDICTDKATKNIAENT